MPSTHPSLADVVAVLDADYDPRWADDWDAVGTAVGDPDATVAKVLFAVDPVRPVVEEAVQWGADLVVTHHPLLLKGVHSVAATTPKGRVIHTLISQGIALHTCHTNADSPDGGVSDSMARALGLGRSRPIESAPSDPIDKWVTFVPHDDVATVTAALVGVGAGAIGDYDSCTFTSSGFGTFRPLTGADPTIGRVGTLERVPETRLEMVAARHLRSTVLAALRGSHPYEEPAFDLLELAELPGTRGSGRFGDLDEATTLERFAVTVRDALPRTHSAVRIAGDPGRLVRRVALCGGSGDFLLDRVRAAGADVYVTSDLRHHPVSELVEHDGAPAIIDVPHWAAEWTWLEPAAARLAESLAALGTTVETRVSRVITDPWTMHLPWSSDEGADAES